MRRNDIPILLTAALVFADATIVTLALPNLLVDLNTSVYGVAAVLAVYTAVLGCTALVAPRLLRAGSYAWMGVGSLCLFSLACVGCALAGGIAVLLVGPGRAGIRRRARPHDRRRGARAASASTVAPGCRSAC